MQIHLNGSIYIYIYIRIDIDTKKTPTWNFKFIFHVFKCTSFKQHARHDFSCLLLVLFLVAF